MPVVCVLPQVTLPQVGDLATRFRELRLVVVGTDYRQGRWIRPLMTTFPNVYLAVGISYPAHMGTEELVAAVGPERLVFGTGFPQAEPTAAITLLTYSALNDEQKRLIGAGNMRRLISEVQR